MEPATCPCGSNWFDLEPFVTSDSRGLGALQVTPTGGILGYSGIFVCTACGDPLEMVEVFEPVKLRLVT